MKVLVVGDFHGKFPAKLKKRILKEKVDFVIGVGDYFPFGYREIWFEHCYKKEIDLWEVIGKNKYKKLEMKDLNMGKKLLSQLNNLGKKIYSITGNIDRTSQKEAHKSYDKKQKGSWKWPEQDFMKKFSKNLKNFSFFDFSFFDLGEVVLIGYPRSTFPGHVKSKQYKKQRIILEKLFKKFKKRKIVFVSHNCPYETKLDLIKDKEAHKEAKGKHYGSKLVKRMVKKYQPFLVLCGHMHENQGKDKIGKSLVLNVGAASEGEAAIVEIDDKRSVKVKFIK